MLESRQIRAGWGATNGNQNMCGGKRLVPDLYGVRVRQHGAAKVQGYASLFQQSNVECIEARHFSISLADKGAEIKCGWSQVKPVAPRINQTFC